MSREVITKSEEETRQLASEFAGKLKPGAVVCLKGDLGAGKTQFVKGLASWFGIESSRVHSPTYTLIHEYSGSVPVYHFDCYRLKSPQEALEIGAEEYFYGGGVSVIEWPEKMEALIPDDARWIRIESIDPETRKVIFDNEKE